MNTPPDAGQPASSPPDPAEPAESPAAESPTYDGKVREVFVLALRNAGLTLVTLGIYRFWAKTRMRQYFWGHVAFHGERIEYTGRGMELFLGFLIVLGVGLVTLLPYQLGLNYVARINLPLYFAGVLLLYLVLMFLYWSAVFFARRYRFSRTQWRGIRAAQTGSAWEFGFLGLGCTLLNAITAGITVPVTSIWVNRYLMTRTMFGPHAFAFEGRAGRLYGPWMIVWGVSFLGFLVVVGIAAAVAAALNTVGDAADAPNIQRMQVIFPFLYAVWIALILIMYGWYRVVQFRRFTEWTRYQTLSFASALPARRVIGMIVLYMLVVVVVLGILIGIAAAAGFSMIHLAFDPRATAIAVGAVMVVYLPAASIARYLIVVHGVAGPLCRTLEVRGTIDYDALKQSAEAMPKRGEGLAEMLDVGGI
ncbi:MAG TPA: DUF898 family protein [Alphaproteobacteria bacterium]|nr:DUF898 family protein [Alphaproteobacteria bacterium]